MYRYVLYIYTQMSTVLKVFSFIYTGLVGQTTAHFCGLTAPASHGPGTVQAPSLSGPMADCPLLVTSLV